MPATRPPVCPPINAVCLGCHVEGGIAQLAADRGYPVRMKDIKAVTQDKAVARRLAHKAR